MDNGENIQVVGTMSDYVIQKIKDESQNEDYTKQSLKASFLASAVDVLFYARRQAGLTQAQVAEIMQTKQAAIARLEADTSGSMSLHRYIEFALACGMVPLDMKLAPINTVRDYVLDNPEAPRTADMYSAWLKDRGQTHDALQAAANTAQTTVSTVATNLLQEVKNNQDKFKVIQLQSSQISQSGNTTTDVSSHHEVSTMTGVSANPIQPVFLKDKVAA